MINYLITDQRALGILAWVSGVLTLIGLAVAIIQSTRAKNAADAARDASQSMIKLVQNREALIVLTASQGHLKSAQSYLSRGVLEAGCIHVDLLRSSLTQVCELISDDRQVIKKSRNLLVRTSTLSEKLARLSDEQPDKREMMPSIIELTQLSGLLDEVTAHRRYTYELNEANR